MARSVAAAAAAAARGNWVAPAEIGMLATLLIFLHLTGGAPIQISERFQNSYSRRAPIANSFADLQRCRCSCCCRILKESGAQNLRLRGGQETKFVNLVADVITTPPEGYDDMFPCPKGDESLARAEEALKLGNVTLARNLQQEAVDYFTEDFALSKNLNAIEALDKRIGTLSY